MNETKYKFSEQFTDCPGGRFASRSEKSGEEFRTTVLAPLLSEYDHILLDMNDVLFGFPPSFLDEVFGPLIKKYGRAELERRLTIVLTDDDVASRAIAAVYDKHSTANS